MSGRIVRIGSGSAFVNDSALAVPQLLASGPLDYITLEYLAEGIMAWLAEDERRAPGTGFSRNLVDVHIGPHLAEIMARGVKIITNGGGMNPHAAATLLRDHAAALGFRPRIAVVTGDDLRPLAAQLAAAGTREMYSGAPFPAAVTSANAYLGAFPIAAALAKGADIVITGRAVDSALALGPLIHEFGWTSSDYDRLAAGTAVGHLLECGAQATGGTFTDWRDVPGWDNMGYPIAECSADGTFVITKPAGTGGLVTVGTVSEQFIYEVQDTQAYMVPDVACDFSAARVEQIGPDRVRVSNVRGRAPTATYKVTATYEDGWRGTASFVVIGFDAAERARRSGAALVARVRAMLRQRNLPDFTDTLVEVLGSEAVFGAHARPSLTREVVCRMVVRHPDKAGADLFGSESRSLATNMSAGTTGLGLAVTAPVLSLFSCLVDKDRVHPQVTIAGAAAPVAIDTRGGFDPATLADYPRPVPALPAGETLETVPLIGLAWGRSGDKGDAFNVGVIARHADCYAWLSAALTEDSVGRWFAHVLRDPGQPQVTRHDAPGFHCLNFIVRDALRGGQTSGMRVDCNGKGMAQQLLAMEIPVPSSIARRARARIAQLGIAQLGIAQLGIAQLGIAQLGVGLPDPV